MIRARDVSFAFPGAGSRRAVAGASFEVRDGEWVALAGGNGSGKSTLCRLMAGVLPPREGEILVDGEPAVRAAASSAPPTAIAFQNPDSQFVTSSVARELSFGLENAGLGEREIEARRARAVREFSLEPFLARNPHALSGGEKQRLLLGCLCGMAPRHLILDEPFSFLDAPSRATFLESLRAARRHEGRAIVWSTVSLEEAMLADRVVFLSNGKVLFDGPPGGLPDAIPPAELQSSLVSSAAGSARESPARGGAPPGGTPVVEIADARFERERGGFALEASSLAIAPGERVGVCGPSGSGKTTLLTGCAGLLPAVAGRVCLYGSAVRSRRDFPAGRVAFLFQSPEEGFFAPTVEEEVALAPRARASKGDPREAARRALEEAGLAPEEFCRRSPFGLSQGEKRLVALASVLVLDAGVYFLDEPTIFLDGGARQRLVAAIDRVSARGAAVVIASHDEAFLRGRVDRIVRIENGRVV